MFDKIYIHAKDEFYLHFILFFVFYVVSLLLIVGLDRPLWGDEIHFYEAVKYWGKGFSLSKLSNYGEIVGPLPFMVYAIWGMAINFEIETLRIFSIIIAFITFSLLIKCNNIILSNLLSDSKKIFKYIIPLIFF